MTPKSIKITYWILVSLFALLMLADGGAGIAREKTGREVMAHLGYPVYLMVIMGVAKVLGAIAVIQNYYKTIKEWAFAGFTISFIGACASRLAVGDGAGDLVQPVIFLAVMFVVYFFWKRYEATKAL